MIDELHLGASCASIRPGDVVFSYDPRSEWPLHAGIYSGREKALERDLPGLDVSGVPDPLTPRRNYLGCSEWNASSDWTPDIICRRAKATDPAQVAEVKLIAMAIIDQHISDGTFCPWKRKMRTAGDRLVLDGIPLFLQGTCTQFVEYCYEQAKLDIVRQDIVFDPADRERIYPATQIRAFYTEDFPLQCEWDDRLKTYPECLF